MKQTDYQPNYERMFMNAVMTLVGVGEAAGVRGEDQLNGSLEIIIAIDKLKERRARAQSEVGRLRAERDALQLRLNVADQRVDELETANAALCQTVKHSAMRIKELDLLFGRYLLGMRAAVIEHEHGQGAEAAMRWIFNGLAGPGEFAPDDATDAQAYFDREIVAVDAGMQEVLAFFDPKAAEVPL